MPHTPQGEAADAVARPRPPARDRAGLHRQHQRGDGGRRPARRPQHVREHRDGDEEESRCRAGQGPGGGPRRTGPGQATRRQLPGDSPHQRASERHRPESLDDRLDEHAAPGDRSQQQVADVGSLQRDGPSVTPAAQSERDGQRDERTKYGRTVGRHVGDLLCGRRFIRHQAAQPQDEAAADERREVDAVRHLEPFQLPQAPHPPGAPHRLQDARHALRNATERGAVTLDASASILAAVHLEPVAVCERVSASQRRSRKRSSASEGAVADGLRGRGTHWRLRGRGTQ